ncbi:hypothetical protein HK120_01605, partial [Streptococcus agalactiae]|nr:hypothetical protein [Streptococcus agalactiae]
MNNLEVMKMIRVSFTRGKGTIGDEIRLVNQYYDIDGNFIFEIDPTD